ncbi:aldo/keto reductase [Paenibacillus ferrarius]|uniref:aldo/keto reductase n=1 Tax=Paenibacillus ferrarius TaxID=1469647 RepID=UPI003D2A9DA3
MQYNKLTSTSLHVSQLCLGTMMFGGQTSEADSLKIMDYAFEHGINFVDTANTYNQGESERIIGKALTGRRDEIIVATKVRGQMGSNPNNAGLSRRNIISAVDSSLNRLQTDYIDIYYMHAPDYETSIEETLETMSGLVKSGKIRYIGVSNYAAWQIADMLSVCDKRNYIPPIITQNVYNLITRGIEAELIPFLGAHDMGMVIYNPIAGGFLTGKHMSGLPVQNSRFSNSEVYYNRYWSDENFDAVAKLTKIAEECGQSLLQLAMKWCASRSSVTSIITGVSRLSQIQQNISSMEGKSLDSGTLLKCDDVWSSLIGARFGYNR